MSVRKVCTRAAAAIVVAGVVGITAQTVSAATVIKDFATPTATSVPTDMTVGPNGNIWFTEQSRNKIGMITPTGAITEHAVPTTNSAPTGIATGPNGNIWFTEESASKVGVLNVSTSTFTEYSLGASTLPVGITLGPNNNLWIVEQDGLVVAEMNTSGTIVASYTTKYGGNYITEGPNGDLWITASAYIIKMTPAGVETDYTAPGTQTNVNGNIVTGPDNNLWFANANSNTIVRLTTSGSFTSFTVPTASSSPQFVAKGPDGNIWFTEQNSNSVSSVTTSGTFMSTYAVPTTGGAPLGITAGPQNTIWFTELEASKIGEITGIVVASTTPTPTSSTASVSAPNTGYGMPRHFSAAAITVLLASAIAFASGCALLLKQAFAKR